MGFGGFWGWFCSFSIVFNGFWRVLGLVLWFFNSF